jgi:hypothetical protein
MRFCLVVALALLMPANFPAGADQNKKEASSHIWIREGGKKGRPNNERDRVFRAEVEIEFEQMTSIIGGTILPGTMMRRVHTTAEIHDGKSITCGGSKDSSADDQTKEEGEFTYSFKVEAVDKATVRLHVTTNDIRTYTLKDGSTRSYNLRLQAAKTIKLGEKTRLDLSGESLLGIKANCEGVIEEKVKD